MKNTVGDSVQDQIWRTKRAIGKANDRETRAKEDLQHLDTTKLNIAYDNTKELISMCSF